MSKSNTFETEFLLLVCNNTNIADIGDATGLRGSTTVGSLFFALHTADPGEAGNQSTNEATYGGYARVGVARTAGNLAVSGNQVSNVNEIVFPLGTSGAPAANITHASIGVASAGATKILFRAALSAALVSGLNVQPKLTAGTGFVITED